MSSLAVTLEEWQTRNPQTEPALANYVISPSPQVRQQAENLRQQHSLVVTELRTGVEISTSSYVGRVRLGDLQVTGRFQVIAHQLGVTLFEENVTALWELIEKAQTAIKRVQQADGVE